MLQDCLGYNYKESFGEVSFWKEDGDTGCWT